AVGVPRPTFYGSLALGHSLAISMIPARRPLGPASTPEGQPEWSFMRISKGSFCRSRSSRILERDMWRVRLAARLLSQGRGAILPSLDRTCREFDGPNPDQELTMKEEAVGCCRGCGWVHCPASRRGPLPDQRGRLPAYN